MRLGRRCEDLGFQFERPELDAIYKKFVVLADKIKTVENHHLLELIRGCASAAWPQPNVQGPAALAPGRMPFGPTRPSRARGSNLGRADGNVPIARVPFSAISC